jgi:hypothetical protein
MGNQNPYTEEQKTAQWSKENVQKDKQRSIKHTHKTKDRVARTPLKTEGELRCSGRISSLRQITFFSSVEITMQRICSTCRKHFPVLSSFMTHHWVCK